jgi:transposase
MARPKAAVVVTDEQRRTLDWMACRGWTAGPLARRARIVLACATGLDNRVVAQTLQTSERTVCRWRQRFIHDGLAGLLDEPRPGAPRTIDDTQVEAVLARSLERPQCTAAPWSTRTLAKATGVSPMSVHRIWHAFGLQPSRAQTSTPFRPPGARQDSAPSGPRSQGCRGAATRAPPSSRRCLLGVPRRARRTGASALGRARHPGQLRHAQEGGESALVRTTSAVPFPPQADLSVVGRARRALVRCPRVHSDAKRGARGRRSARRRDSRIHRGVTQSWPAMRVRKNGGGYSRQHAPLRPAHGRDP